MPGPFGAEYWRFRAGRGLIQSFGEKTRGDAGRVGAEILGPALLESVDIETLGPALLGSVGIETLRPTLLGSVGIETLRLTLLGSGLIVGWSYSSSTARVRNTAAVAGVQFVGLIVDAGGKGVSGRKTYCSVNLFRLSAAL